MATRRHRQARYDEAVENYRKIYGRRLDGAPNMAEWYADRDMRRADAEYLMPLILVPGLAGVAIMVVGCVVLFLAAIGVLG